MGTYQFVAIRADGIGPEVIDTGLQVLNTLGPRVSGFRLEVEHFDWNSDSFRAQGVAMQEDALRTLKAFGVI